MLSVPATQIPDAIGERAALWRAQLSRRRAVVILDDAARHDQIRPLLPTAGRCLILITTRRRLPDLEGARTLTLDVLSVDDAITLFRRIAGPGEAQDEDEVATAVGLCGRLPLAIQLTAGRLAQDCPPRLADLIEELSQPPAQLGGAGAASPEVMSAFDLSYRALEPDHQRFFRRLGVSPCASGQPAGCGRPGRLAPWPRQKKLSPPCSIITCWREAPAGQFRFHDLIRGYAAVRAARDDPEPEQRQAVARLLDYYLYTADQADRVLHPFRHRMPVSVTHLPAASPALGTPGRRGRLAGFGMAQHPAGRAARGQARMEAEVRRSHSRAGRLRGDQARTGTRQSRPTHWPCRPAVTSPIRPGSRRRRWSSAW